MSGTKHDKGKPQLSMLPVEALAEAARAFSYGAAKYGRSNYQAGMAHSRFLDAALRHLYAHASGETTDFESGNTHLSHALASVMMLVYTVQHHPELNDLKPREPLDVKQALVDLVNTYNDAAGTATGPLSVPRVTK